MKYGHGLHKVRKLFLLRFKWLNHNLSTNLLSDMLFVLFNQNRFTKQGKKWSTKAVNEPTWGFQRMRMEMIEI